MLTLTIVTATLSFNVLPLTLATAMLNVNVLPLKVTTARVSAYVIGSVNSKIYIYFSVYLSSFIGLYVPFMSYIMAQNSSLSQV